MKQYLKLLNKVLTKGSLDTNRTGTKAIRLFGTKIKFDLKKGFPLLTTKEVSFHNIKEELLWFLSGNTNVNDLKEHGVNIWNEWATPSGDLGPVYGSQWRHWKTKDGYVDQISELLHNLKVNPLSRRHILTAWNVEYLPDESVSPQENVINGKMALAPCHLLCQFFVKENDGKKELSCQIYQRSADMFLGVPYNIASYALLTHILAKYCDYGVGELIWIGGDTHIYENHIEQCKIQLTRNPLKLPILSMVEYPFDRPRIKSIFKIDNLQNDYSIQLLDYKPHPKLTGNVSV